MKIRIRFSKKGSLKFIGHLDMMRYFQRTFRRADLKIRYSEGFSPHPVMSFAAPLGVGLTSDGEYVDIDVNETGPSEVMISRLNDAFVEELRILSYKRLPEHTQKAMAQVQAADYTVRPGPAGYSVSAGTLAAGVESFLKRESIPVLKKTKTSEKTVDIRPMIHSFSVLPDGAVIFRAAAGSRANLKPETLMEAYLGHIGLTLKPYPLTINRDDLLAGPPDEQTFVSLDSFGEEILQGEA